MCLTPIIGDPPPCWRNRRREVGWGQIGGHRIGHVGPRPPNGPTSSTLTSKTPNPDFASTSRAEGRWFDHSRDHHKSLQVVRLAVCRNGWRAPLGTSVAECPVISPVMGPNLLGAVSAAVIERVQSRRDGVQLVVIEIGTDMGCHGDERVAHGLLQAVGDLRRGGGRATVCVTADREPSSSADRSGDRVVPSLTACFRSRCLTVNPWVR